MSHIATLPAIEPTKSQFWRRQFFGPRTLRSTLVDIGFGVVAPLLCFAADPGVMFFGPLSGGLPSIAPLFVLAVAALSMVALIVLLGFGGRSGALDAVLAGILLAGGAVSFVVGVGLLPTALLMLLALIGALGLVPLATSFVCFRNATRVLASPAGRERRGLAALAAVTVLLLGAGYQVGADRVLDALVTDIAGPGSPAAVARLERWRPLLPRREIARLGLAQLNRDDARAVQYGVAYERLTGEHLEVLGEAD